MKVSFIAPKRQPYKEPKLMTISYTALCVLILVGTIVASVFLAPLLWDAAGTIQTSLDNIYTPGG